MDLPLSLRKLKTTATNKDRMQWWRGDRETEKWDTKTKRNASAENAEKARSMCIIQCGVHDDGWWLVAMVMMPWGVMVAMTLAIRRGGRCPGSSASLARMQDCRWPCLYVCVCADGFALDLSYSIWVKTKPLLSASLHFGCYGYTDSLCLTRCLAPSKNPPLQSHKPPCGGVT